MLGRLGRCLLLIEGGHPLLQHAHAVADARHINLAAVIARNAAPITAFTPCICVSIARPDVYCGRYRGRKEGHQPSALIGVKSTRLDLNQCGRPAAALE
jgi:hypothetical protein